MTTVQKGLSCGVMQVGGGPSTLRLYCTPCGWQGDEGGVALRLQVIEAVRVRNLIG